MRLAEVTCGMGAAGDIMVGEQTGAVRKDRECNARVGEGGSLFCPVLLSHQEPCSWVLMFLRSTLVPLLFKWRLSGLYRSPLVQKESKLLIKPWPFAIQNFRVQQCSAYRRLKFSLFFLDVGIGPEKIHVLPKLLIDSESNLQDV